MKQVHYRVRIKEWNMPHWMESDYIGNKIRREIIEFYGLDKPDVEDYEIEVVGEDKEGQTAIYKN